MLEEKKRMKRINSIENPKVIAPRNSNCKINVTNKNTLSEISSTVPFFAYALINFQTAYEFS